MLQEQLLFGGAPKQSGRWLQSAARGYTLSFHFRAREFDYEVVPLIFHEMGHAFHVFETIPGLTFTSEKRRPYH